MSIYDTCNASLYDTLLLDKLVNDRKCHSNKKCEALLYYRILRILQNVLLSRKHEKSTGSVTPKRHETR